jgi:hypothetical protein
MMPRKENLGILTELTKKTDETDLLQMRVSGLVG